MAQHPNLAAPSMIDTLDLIATQTPLDRIETLRDLTTIAEHNTTQAVREARSQGATWEQIAAALGVSRSAAWQRYNT